MLKKSAGPLLNREIEIVNEIAASFITIRSKRQQNARALILTHVKKDARSDTNREIVIIPKIAATITMI